MANMQMLFIQNGPIDDKVLNHQSLNEPFPVKATVRSAQHAALIEEEASKYEASFSTFGAYWGCVILMKFGDVMLGKIWKTVKNGSRGLRKDWIWQNWQFDALFFENKPYCNKCFFFENLTIAMPLRLLPRTIRWPICYTDQNSIWHSSCVLHCMVEVIAAQNHSLLISEADQWLNPVSICLNIHTRLSALDINHATWYS